MNLKQSFILGLILAIIGIAGWEMYWRSQDHIPNLDDNDDTWAIQRAKLERPSKDQVVFIGSSRILFDIQHPIWRAKTGTEPVQLASQGSSPLPILKDVVENTDFNGLMVVGVTPGLFFRNSQSHGTPDEMATRKSGLLLRSNIRPKTEPLAVYSPSTKFCLCDCRHRYLGHRC